MLFIILSLISSSKVLASNYLVDDFSSLENWNFIPNNSDDLNSWTVLDNKLVGTIGRRGSSFLISKINDFSKDLNFTFRSQNISGIDQEILFGIKDIHNYYVLNIRFEEPLWPQDVKVNQVVLWKYYSGKYHEIKRINLADLGVFLKKNSIYKTSIITNGENEVKVYIDDILVLSIVDQDLFFGGIGFWNWGGDFDKSKTINYFFDLEVNLNLIPTPTPSPKKKIFILPGLGASWNPEAIVYDVGVANDSWTMTPFVNNYDGLIENLKKNDLVQNEDFFVWNYDWRKSINEIGNDFNNFLISKNIGDNDEIYLVGHSLGGVVARVWAQDHLDDQRLKNVITLGSPHLGSLDTYTVWNGGKVANSKGINSVAFQILLNLKNKGLVANLTKLRSYAPVIKDLLPTYDNYVLKNDVFLKQDQLETKNDFLINKNNQISSLSDKLKLSVGIGFSTPSVIKLTGRSGFDKFFGLWPDGKFIGYDYDVGDNTVLKGSAGFGSTNLSEINSDHGGIVNNSLDFIMSNLGLENKNIDFVYNDNFDDSLVVFVGSPAEVSLKCGNETFNEVNGFVVVNKKNYSECDLNLNPTSTGTVHLVTGNTNDNNWNYFEKDVILGNPEKVIIDFKDGDIKIDKLNKDFLIAWIKSDLQKLGLDNAIKYLDKGDLNKVVKIVFTYRWKTKEVIISQRILDNLFILSSISKPNRKSVNYKWMYTNKVFLGKKMRSNYFSALGFEKLEELGRNKFYPEDEILAIFVNGYSSEVLGN